MESCLLCLEINIDFLDCIKSNSTQWAELNITKIIEKHFWPLKHIQLGSWICSTCWREVEDFHKFYLRIEETHLNSGQIKLENYSVALNCKEELTVANSVKDDSEGEKETIEFCILEPEVLIDQTKQQHLTEPEIYIDHATALHIDVENEATTSDASDELDDISLKQAYKRLKLKNNIGSRDPLEKSKRCKRKASSIEKFTENDATYKFKVKEEPLDSNNIGYDSDSLKANDISDVTYKTNPSKITDNDNKRRTSRKENDEFIAKHFKQMFCDLCQVPFVTFPSVQKHFADHHKQPGYVVCCNRKFFGRTRLIDHLHSHLNPDHLKCNICDKVMSDRSCFESHILRVHGVNEVVKQHSCDICGKSFIKAYALRTHKLSHLPEEEKKFPCADCGKNYGSSYLLNQHRQVVHLKRFLKVCYICGKSTNSNAEFKIHMNRHEGIPIPIINCDVCGLRLTSARGLKVHKESQHPVGGKQEHPCPFCQRVSPTLKTLKKHINTMHKKGSEHKCSICEKAFKRSEALREHIATHTGTALYTCPWCPKTFNSNGNMHAHRKKMHRKEWEDSKLQKYSSKILPEI